MVKKNTDYTNIPKEKFEFYKRDESIHDKKLETKPVGYFKDAMRRFAKNKSSVVAAYIILALVLFAIFIPIFVRTITRRQLRTRHTYSTESFFQRAAFLHGQAGTAAPKRHSRRAII